jgi:hypothetical protein
MGLLSSEHVELEKGGTIMFNRNLIPIWVGILMMASFFLMGQDWGPSATGGGLHVIDAQGNDVGIGVTAADLFAPSTLFDPSLGLVYRVDFWTGQTSPHIEQFYRYFESDDCSGPWYTQTFPPGQTFSFSDDPTVYSVTAVANKTMLSFLSLIEGGSCSSEGSPIVGPPLGELAPFGTSQLVTLPSSFPAPLHYEIR